MCLCAGPRGPEGVKGDKGVGEMGDIGPPGAAGNVPHWTRDQEVVKAAMLCSNPSKLDSNMIQPKTEPGCPSHFV